MLRHPVLEEPGMDYARRQRRMYLEQEVKETEPEVGMKPKIVCNTDVVVCNHTTMQTMFFFNVVLGLTNQTNVANGFLFQKNKRENEEEEEEEDRRKEEEEEDRRKEEELLIRKS